MDIAFIADNFFFNNGFVRTIVMRFTDGWTELNPVWAQLIGMNEAKKKYFEFGLINSKHLMIKCYSLLIFFNLP